MTARHESVLRSLSPVSIGGDDPAILSAEAALLDSAQDALAVVENDIFVSSTSQLSRFESVYNLSSLGTNAQRQARILAAISAQGGLSKAYFLGLATAMGYSIQISSGLSAFIAGISAAGESVGYVDSIAASFGLTPPPGWDVTTQGPYPADFWIWTVQVIGLGSNPNTNALKSLFLALRPVDTSICWIEGASTTLLGIS